MARFACCDGSLTNRSARFDSEERSDLSGAGEAVRTEGSFVRFRAVMMVTRGCCIVVVMRSMYVIRSWRRDARAERDGQRPAFARQHETHGHEGAQQHERQQPGDPWFETSAIHKGRRSIACEQQLHCAS